MSASPTSAEPVEFTVAYDGPALDDHTIDAKDLAPSMLAMAQAFERANAVLNGNKASMSLRIRATEPGSFEILVYLQQTYHDAINVLSGDLLMSAANIKELFFGPVGAVGGATTGGVIGILKKLRRRKLEEVIVPTTEQVEKVAPAQLGVCLRIDGNEIWVSEEALRLLSDQGIQANVGDMVKPLLKEGIEKMLFKERDKELESVTKKEAPYMTRATRTIEYTDEGAIVLNGLRLQPVSPDFRPEGSRWKLNDGDQTRTYKMSDGDFMDKFADGSVRIGAKDVIVCDVMKRQAFTRSGRLRNSYEVINVREVHAPGAQGFFQVDTGGNLSMGVTDTVPKDSGR